jgi:GDP/UDP-N,N'-diacetylbacillosamine 2-epimerase (hydrolysing)
MKKQNKRKICIVTGSRSEYGLLKMTMKEIQNSKKLSLQVLATGMHLASDFGSTKKEIEKDGFRISAEVKSTPLKDTPETMAESIGRGIIGMARIFKKIKPDVVMVQGDRVEALSAAIAASYMQIAVAHTHGGDLSRAGLDEYARHAITKIAHIHFPATKKSAERIIKMGEDKKRVFVVGALGLDSILHERLPKREEIRKKYKLDSSKLFLLALQHSVTTEVKDAAKQIKETMEAIKELGYQTIVIYPNSDAGGRATIRVIERYRKYPFIKIYKNIPHLEYLGLMKTASAMIGNSSSGIIEAPSFHLPVVNVGIRQEGRERAENVLDVGYNKEKIKAAIKKVLQDRRFTNRVKNCRNLYGNGRAGKRIAAILAKIKIDKNLFKKKLTY